MPSLKKYAPHGIAAGQTPDAALTSIREGNLVVPPFGGPMAKLPAHLDPMAFSVFVDDFYRLEESGTNIGGWKQNDIGNGITGPVISASYSLNGEIDFATDDTAVGDGAHFQWDAAGINNLATTRPYWFTIRIKLPTANTSAHVRCGLAATTANPFAADPNGVFFVIGETVDGAISTIVKNAAGTTETATGETFTGNTWHELAWRYDGTDIKFYLDRELIDTVTTNIPVGLGLEPFFACISRAAEAVAKIVAVDFVQVITKRPEDA